MQKGHVTKELWKSKLFIFRVTCILESFKSGRTDNKMHHFQTPDIVFFFQPKDQHPRVTAQFKAERPFGVIIQLLFWRTSHPQPRSMATRPLTLISALVFPCLAVTIFTLSMADRPDVSMFARHYLEVGEAAWSSPSRLLVSPECC